MALALIPSQLWLNLWSVIKKLTLDMNNGFHEVHARVDALETRELVETAEDRDDDDVHPRRRERDGPNHRERGERRRSRLDQYDYEEPRDEVYRNYGDYDRRDYRRHDVSNIKVDAPEFDGRFDPDAFLTSYPVWRSFFEWHGMGDGHRVRFAKKACKTS